jgi:hypothetical protein
MGAPRQSMLRQRAGTNLFVNLIVSGAAGAAAAAAAAVTLVTAEDKEPECIKTLEGALVRGRAPSVLDAACAAAAALPAGLRLPLGRGAAGGRASPAPRFGRRPSPVYGTAGCTVGGRTATGPPPVSLRPLKTAAPRVLPGPAPGAARCRAAQGRRAARRSPPRRPRIRRWRAGNSIYTRADWKKRRESALV